MIRSKSGLRDGAKGIDESLDHPPIELNEVLTAISNRRRRFVIHYLKQSTSAVSTGELATKLAAWELDKPADMVSASERKNMYNALAQTHIRRLSECGFVTEQEDGVELTPEARRIRIHLDVAPDRDVPWSRYYLILGGFHLAASVAVLAVAPSSGAIPIGAWGVFVAVSILASALAHRYYRKQMCIGEGDQPPELRHEL
ncbi:MAG: hypothetical protein A07HB70_01775 [uncultured archaeon A07HB70]|nr:MAG: hypothetical protein A07HB70_01775 [uncultured archaeon A07HB70]